MVLKYKLSNPKDGQTLKIDRRKSYSNLNIIDIAEFSFKVYANRINKIRKTKYQKLSELRTLNKKLVQKKQYWKEQLTKLNYTEHALYDFFIFLQKIQYGLGEEQARRVYENQKSDYARINYILQNLNNDIYKLNEIKKEIKKVFNYYESINLTYDNRAKITRYDLKRLKKDKVITQNVKEVFYYYITQLKKSSDRALTRQDIKPLFESLFSQEKLNSLVKHSEKESLKYYTFKQLESRLSSLEDSIIKKWL